MSRDFLQLWHHTTASKEVSQGRTLRNSGSKQQRLHRIEPDDTVWIVTVHPPGELVLLGRLIVDECTDFEGAKKRLGTDDVWEANYHVIAKPSTEEALHEINLMDIADALRFRSKEDHLRISDGRVDAKQLQTIRELTEESATMLKEKWSRTDRTGSYR